jgi:addiction module RelB/DinJ family antitoxin
VVSRDYISIRIDADLKEQTESVLAQLGLNMTVVVNMLFCQIVREQTIPLSLSLKPQNNVLDELLLAQTERNAGHTVRTAESVLSDMERIITAFEPTA